MTNTMTNTNTQERKFYTANGWQGSKYEISKNWTVAEIAKAIKKDLKTAFPGFKFSVTSDSYSMGRSIDARIISGYIPQYIESNNGDYEENPEFIKIVEKCKAIYNAYNYDDSDIMTDYFDTNYYGCCKASYNYKHTPETEPKQSKAAATDGGNLDGVNYEVIDDIDTRNGDRLTVVKLVDHVSRDEYKAIAEVMKNYGGYYSRFKGGFIFRNRPAFLAAETAEEEKAVDILATIEETAEPEQLPQFEEVEEEETEENTIEYINPSTLSDGDEITLTNIQQRLDRKAIFHCYTPSENSIAVTMSNGLAVGVRKIYELGDRFQITAAKRQEAEPQPEEVATDEPQEEETQEAGKFTTRGRNIYYTCNNSDLKIINDFSKLEAGKQYTIVKYGYCSDDIEIINTTIKNIEFSDRYAQYTKAAKITHRKRRHRLDDSAIFHNESKYIIYCGTLPALPDSVMYDVVSKNNQVVCKMSKFSSCDVRNWIEIYNYYKSIGFEPLAMSCPTHTPDDDPTDPEPIGEDVASVQPSAVVVPKLPKNLIQQANSNSHFNRGDSSACTYAAYCQKVLQWDISDEKKQSIIDKIYKKYLPIMQNQAAFVPWTVAGRAKYNSKKLDKSEKIMQLSIDFQKWFENIENGLNSRESTGSDEKIERLIDNIKYCCDNADNKKLPFDWCGICRRHLESLAAISQADFVEQYEKAHKTFNFRKSTNIYKLYTKAASGEQITAEPCELFTDDNIKAYQEGDRVYIRFFVRPAQQLKFALKKRGFWWNAYRSEWSTYSSRYNAEWVQSISKKYAKYI